MTVRCFHFGTDHPDEVNVLTGKDVPIHWTLHAKKADFIGRLYGFRGLNCSYLFADVSYCFTVIPYFIEGSKANKLLIEINLMAGKIPFNLCKQEFL